MNKHLHSAFECIRHARKVCVDIIEDPEMHTTNQQGPSFYAPVWEQAFTQTFDKLLALKSAPDKEAATIGLVLLKVIDGLVNQLIEMPENRLGLGTLCMMFRPEGLDQAEKYFGWTLQDIEEQEAMQKVVMEVLRTIGYRSLSTIASEIDLTADETKGILVSLHNAGSIVFDADFSAVLEVH